MVAVEVARAAVAAVAAEVGTVAAMAAAAATVVMRGAAMRAATAVVRAAAARAVGAMRCKVFRKRKDTPLYTAHCSKIQFQLHRPGYNFQ